jgi:hypothetical protein
VQRRTRSRVVSVLARIIFFCTVLVVCHAPVPALTESNNRIICREELATAHREVLAEKLQAITGLQITFDERGALRVISTKTDGGSSAARHLVSKALSGPRIIVLEDASKRQDVVFSRAFKWNHHASKPTPVSVVLIDFADFEHLLGDREALRAFNVGWAFLHELDHVVNDSADAQTANEPGGCENHINIMREECGLPRRAEYFYNLFPNPQHGQFRTRFVRLAFDQKDAVSNKRHRYWLMWDAIVVGGLEVEVAKAR